MTKSPRRGPEEWRQIIESQQTSGMTVARYCRDRGVTECSFYNWKKRLRGASPSRPKHLPVPAFVEVTPSNPAKAGGIEILLCDSRRLRVSPGFDRQLLLDLIHTLEALA
jgi:transposase-like protein